MPERGDERPESSDSARRLDVLDGLRGIAALYVVLHHAATEFTEESLSTAARLVRAGLRPGHFAVAVFIVLSGFCLFRSVLCSTDRRLQGGLIGYLGRRARRILPPYYAALAASMLLIANVPGLDRPTGSRWDRALPAFEPGVVVSHLILVHNLNERWIFRIDPPLWSVATEAQIYLVFPVLLMVWRRLGISVTLAVALLLGFGIAMFAEVCQQPALAQLCPWYLGLFAMGMTGASWASSGCVIRGSRVTTWTTGFLAVVLGFAASRTDAIDRSVMFMDLIVGAASTVLIVVLTRPGRRHGLLASRPARRLGAFSYSLYLTHFPVLALAGKILRAERWATESRFWGLVLIGVPGCLLVASGFYWLFERSRPNPIEPHSLSALRWLLSSPPSRLLLRREAHRTGTCRVEAASRPFLDSRSETGRSGGHTGRS